MVDGMLKLIPAAKVGHIGLYRDPETLEAGILLQAAPGLPGARHHSGGPDVRHRSSIDAALNLIKRKGCDHIKLVCLVAAQQGIDLIQKNHPDVDIFAAVIDDHLNDHGYIVPGLGDAGDRYFGTK